MVRAPGVLSRPVSRGLVVSTADGQFLRLPLSTEVVWYQFYEPATRQRAAHQLREEFDLSSDDAEQLVERAVVELLDVGLLTEHV